MDRIGINHRVALNDVRMLALEIPRRLKPVFAIRVSVIDHQRVSFPTANGFRMPESDGFRKTRATVRRNDAIVVHLLVKDYDVPGRLDDLQSIISETVTRWRGHGA